MKLSTFDLCKQNNWRWVRTVVSTLAMIGVIVLITACGADGSTGGNIPTVATMTTVDEATPTGTDGATPTPADGTTPTPTDDTTPTPTAAETQTTVKKTTPAIASGSTPTTANPKSTILPTPTPTTAPAPTATPTPVSAAAKTVTVWLQATDSCMEALPGAAFIVNGPDMANKVTGMTPGTFPAGVPTYVHGHCPVDRGTCVRSTTGCVTAILNIPASGTAAYKITPRVIAGKQYIDGIVVLVPAQYRGQGAFDRNYSYVECEGGSDCRYGPEVATVRVSSSGAVSATTQNINPDGYKDKPWPSTGAFTGQQSDPIEFHLFGASAPDDFSLPCVDGGHGLRDHMTGYRWPHCNSGR